MNSNNNYNTIPVHQDDWNNAIAKNPNSKALYPYIIGSYEELSERVQQDVQSLQEIENGYKIIDNKKAAINKNIEEIENISAQPKIRGQEIIKKIGCIIILLKRYKELSSNSESLNKEDSLVSNMLSRIASELSPNSQLMNAVEDTESQAAAVNQMKPQSQENISENKAIKTVYLINEYLEGITNLTKQAEENQKGLDFIKAGIKKLEEEEAKKNFKV